MTTKERTEGREERLTLPDGVRATRTDDQLRLEGPKGVIVHHIPAVVVCSVEGNTIILRTIRARKLEKKMIYTTLAHVRNNVQGVLQGHCYRMKVCSGHFPMNVSVTGRELSVKNFLGEKLPRKLLLPEAVEVKVNGTELVLNGCSLQSVSQCAAAIEHLTTIRNRDRRVFQDGIFLTERNNVSIKAG